MGTGIGLAVPFGTLLVGCSSEQLPEPCAAATAPNGDEVTVYFGCGCFWHMQHEFAILEIKDLCRQDGDISVRASYAGSKQTGSAGKVCYHNGQGVADYGEMGHGEVVGMSVPKSKFGDFAAKFWEVCPGGGRQDPQDAGGEYRSLIGLPGGVDSELMTEVRKHAGSTNLVAGSGSEGDTEGTGKVYVYDTTDFPAHTAEQYHQFHNDMMATYGTEYNELQRFASTTSCPGDGDSIIAQ